MKPDYVQSILNELERDGVVVKTGEVRPSSLAR
jgi:hypothetical protein